MADDGIAEVVTAIAAIENAIAAPTGYKKPAVYDDLTAAPGVWPVFLNVPLRSVRTAEAGGIRAWDHTVEIYLLFGDQEYKYASAAQRAWVPLVIDAFDASLHAGNAVAGGYAIIDSVDYSLGNLSYIGVKFTLTIHAYGTFNYRV